jgi:hypothetical protein
MKWKVRKPNARMRAKHLWHKWYAWYPVRVPTKGKMSGMTMVWLETIERKGSSCYLGDDVWQWSYRSHK